MLCVVGAGAMGTALAVHCLRAGTPASLLATEFDEAVVAVSSYGIREVVHRAAPMAAPDATWIVATKGWDEHTLQSCSEVVDSAVPSCASVAISAGPRSRRSWSPASQPTSCVHRATARCARVYARCSRRRRSSSRRRTTFRGSLPIARAVADAIDGNAAQTVWLSALSDLLEQPEPWESP